MMILLALAGMVAGIGALTLNQAGFVQLPDGEGNGYFGNNAATAAAYDKHTHLLYVIGTKANVLNVIDVKDVNNPRSVIKAKFSSDQGMPDAVAICRHDNNPFKHLAISFEKVGAEYHAFVRIYRLLESFDENLGDHKQIALDGVDPTSMAFTSDCNSLLVVQEGRPQKLVTVFKDPEPALNLVTNLNSISPGRIKINMRAERALAAGARHVFKRCDDSTGDDSTLLQDLEPRRVTMDKDDIAYISFPKNNVIAGLDLASSDYNIIYQDTETKDWQNLGIDCASNDDVGFQTFPIHTFYQPVDLAQFHYNDQTYLASADGGHIMSLNLQEHGCLFDESKSGINWLGAGNSVVGTTSDVWDVLKIAMNETGQLGQMKFTTVRGRGDYFDPTLLAYSQVTGYGGRGMSILKPAERRRVFDSEDQFERQFDGGSTDMQSVFNADVGDRDSSPASRKDYTSPTTGPTPNAIATGLLGSTRVFVVANGHVGGLYFYTMNAVSTDGSEPIPTIRRYFRRGQTSQSWSSLYNNPGDVGEPITKNIQWIDGETNNQAAIAVLGDRAGVVSLYHLSI